MSRASKLLGEPPLEEILLVEAAHPAGVTLRDLLVRHPETLPRQWYGAIRDAGKRLRQEWSTVKQPAAYAQEGRYFLKASDDKPELF